MIVASTFLDVLWTMLLVFAWISFFMLLFYALADLFSRHDASGWKKAVWIVFMLVLPFVGVLSYFIANGSAMAERRMGEAQAAQAATDEYIRQVAGTSTPADEIATAKQLLDSGAITPGEFDRIKTQALGTP
jgi:predicted PurR-regulated permease PerM